MTLIPKGRNSSVMGHVHLDQLHFLFAHGPGAMVRHVPTRARGGEDKGQYGQCAFDSRAYIKGMRITGAVPTSSATKYTTFPIFPSEQ
jgi:hypothetical protein